MRRGSRWHDLLFLVCIIRSLLLSTPALAAVTDCVVAQAARIYVQTDDWQSQLNAVKTQLQNAALDDDVAAALDAAQHVGRAHDLALAVTQQDRSDPRFAYQCAQLRLQLALARSSLTRAGNAAGTALNATLQALLQLGVSLDQASQNLAACSSTDTGTSPSE